MTYQTTRATSASRHRGSSPSPPGRPRTLFSLPYLHHTRDLQSYRLPCISAKGWFAAQRAWFAGAEGGPRTGRKHNRAPLPQCASLPSFVVPQEVRHHACLYELQLCRLMRLLSITNLTEGLSIQSLQVPQSHLWRVIYLAMGGTRPCDPESGVRMLSYGRRAFLSSRSRTKSDDTVVCIRVT